MFECEIFVEVVIEIVWCVVCINEIFIYLYLVRVVRYYLRK